MLQEWESSSLIEHLTNNGLVYNNKRYMSDKPILAILGYQRTFCSTISSEFGDDFKAGS
jgi:hypothetical protein